MLDLVVAASAKLSRVSATCFVPLLLLLLLALSAAAQPRAPCCNNSSGSVSPFVGSIDDSSSLSAALIARSVQREVILLADIHTGAMHQSYSLLTSLGLYHVLVMMLDSSKCDSSRQLFPDLGCCWSTLRLPRGLTGSRKMATLRAITAARIVSLGYNLLLLDSDALVLRNPYEFLKAPPFSAHHLLAMRGGLPRTASSAAMYIQGAAPSGPVARVMEEAAVRMLRWSEYATAQPGTSTSVLQTFSNTAPPGCPEASLWTDVILSSLLSRPVHWNCFRPSPAVVAALGVAGRLPQAIEEWDAAHVSSLGLSGEGLKGLLLRQMIKSEALQALTMSKSYPVYSAPLKLMSELRPLELQEGPLKAHVVYTSISQHKDGPSISNLRALLEADRALRREQEQSSGAARTAAGAARRLHAARTARGAPLSRGLRAAAPVLGAEQGPRPPRLRPGPHTRHLHQGDQEHATGVGSEAGGQAAGGAEVFALAPDWLFGSWTDRGVLGYWDPGLAGRPPRQVVASLGRVPGSTNTGVHAVRMAFGFFDWSIVHRQARLLGGSTAPGSLPKLLALAPALVARLAAGGGDGAAWLAALRGLVQVAALSGRMPVWPDLPCNASWLGPDPGSGGRLPLRKNAQVIPYGSLQQLTCMPQQYLSHHCLHVFSATWLRSPWFRSQQRAEEVPFRGMLQVEAAHVVELVRHGGGRPSARNTVSFSMSRAAAQQQQQPPAVDNRTWWEAAGGGRQQEQGSLPADGGGDIGRARVVGSGDVLQVLGNSEDGLIGRMDGEVIVYLAHAVAVVKVPLQATARIMALLSKCPVFLQPTTAPA